MGLWGRFKRAATEVTAPKAYEAAGRQITCRHCGESRFERSQAQLNTAGMTFLNLDWANRSAAVLICANCGRIEWFLHAPEQME